MSDYLDFERIYVTPVTKTQIWAVRPRNSGQVLGFVKWFGRWRQYCFFPQPDTIWNRDCMGEVMGLIRRLMEERRGR